MIKTACKCINPISDCKRFSECNFYCFGRCMREDSTLRILQCQWFILVRKYMCDLQGRRFLFMTGGGGMKCEGRGPGCVMRGGGGRNKNPHHHHSYMLRRPWNVFRSEGGGGLKYYDQVKQSKVERKLAWGPGGGDPRSSGVLGIY